MRALDLALRSAFFLIAPFLLVALAARFPMTGVLVNVVLMLAVFVLGEAVRARVERSKLAQRILKRQLAFEAYYRERAPRPFVYYLLYPLCAPYWLYDRDARREFLLYRGLTGGGLAILVISAGVDYFRRWLPEVGVGAFLRAYGIVFVAQSLLLLVFLLPIATTVVSFHRDGRVRTLKILLGVGLASAALAAGLLMRRHAPSVSYLTMTRLRARTEAASARAEKIQLEALRAAWADLPTLSASIDEDGWVEGTALERAAARLGAFYREDEAAAFSLLALPPKSPDVLLLQVQAGRGTPIWRALRRSGAVVKSSGELPSGSVGATKPPKKTPGVLKKK